MTRPTRAHKSHLDNEQPLALTDEMCRLMAVYQDCPGIVDDLRLLVADLELREERMAS